MAEEEKPPQEAEKKDATKPEQVELKVRLRKPVQAHGDEINELVFREPTGGDIERIGNPVIMDVFSQELKINFDSKAMTQMMSVLAGVPPSTIRQLHPRDWNQGAWLLANFFMPEVG